MTKEIPLSLQVFHSHNEYKAHRRNKTEQLRLRDVAAVLEREERLYNKDFAIHKYKFHTHYARRFSDPLVGSAHGRSPSKLSRASLFSAPATLRHLSDARSATSPSFESVNEISSTSTSRFQRVQRKFSVASFLENGLLTAIGTAMSQNLRKARQVLFSGKWTSGGKGKASLMSLKEDDENNDGQEEDDADGAAVQSVELIATQIQEPKMDAHTAAPNVNDDSAQDNNIAHNSGGTDDSNHNHNNNSNYNDDNDNHTGTKSPSFIQSSILKGRTAKSSSLKRQQSLRWAQEEKTIPESVDREDTPVSRGSLSGTPSPRITSENTFTDWKSFFSRPLAAARLNPLQAKIKQFLAQQSDFNKQFPGVQSEPVETTGIHQELMAKEKKRKEEETLAKKRKREIVNEVLQTLGIKDEQILCHYK